MGEIIEHFLKGEIWVRFSNKDDWDDMVDYLSSNHRLKGNIKYFKDNYNYYNCMKIGNSTPNRIYLIRTNYYKNMAHVCSFEELKLN